MGKRHSPLRPPPAPRGAKPHECPANDKTGVPDVWYNRTKRCEWDFDPPCGPCEGIGGNVWGDKEDQYEPPRCKLHTKAEDIPKDNLTVFFIVVFQT